MVLRGRQIRIRMGIQGWLMAHPKIAYGRIRSLTNQTLPRPLPLLHLGLGGRRQERYHLPLKHARNPEFPSRNERPVKIVEREHEREVPVLPGRV